MTHGAVLIWSQRWEGAEPKPRPGTSADKFVESEVLLRGGDGGESGGVNGVEMSCRMMGHYFWHCSSEPLVFRSAANLQSRLLQGPQAKGVRGMKLTRLTESVNLPTKKSPTPSTFMEYLIINSSLMRICFERNHTVLITLEEEEKN